MVYSTCDSCSAPCSRGPGIVYGTVYVIPIVRTYRIYGDALFHSVHGSFYTGPVKGVTWGGRGGGKCSSNIVRRFAELLKATISFAMSGCLCLSAWNILLRLNIFFRKCGTSIFRKFVEKLQVSLKFEKNNDYLA